MERDFEQIKGDVSCWLRHKKPVARLTSNNPARQFGRLRQYRDSQPNPAVSLVAFELKSVVSKSFLFGGIQVVPIGENGEATPTNMMWDDTNICFTSPLLGTMQARRINDIPGVVLDRLYAQIAFPMLNALSDLHQ